MKYHCDICKEYKEPKKFYLLDIFKFNSNKYYYLICKECKLKLKEANSKLEPL